MSACETLATALEIDVHKLQLPTFRGYCVEIDATAEIQLPDTALSKAAKFGAMGTVDQPDIKIADGGIDAYVRIGRGR